MNALPSLKALSLAALFLMGCASTLTSCKSAGPEPDGGTPGSGSGQAGSVVGKVTDPQGKPLPRATVYVASALGVDRGAETSTNSDGMYKIQLAKNLGHWTTKGYILKQYNDRVYKIQLDPENPDSFSEDEKPVRNFQWKLTGHIPDLSLDLYYGGTAELHRDPNAYELEHDKVEFTFKPVGPLIDGSTGKTLKLQTKKRYDDFIKDIPIGRYTVTATYKPTGEQLRLIDAFGDDYDYKESVTVDFLGTESAVRSNTMGIGYTNRH
ncbi:carboxypeptidase-like regulatory domain-containing protein [Larkinella insperata]|uniref:Carboxypeptidase-like regulatory domain-containing protein n=1 Tax=Larkinella insperata TaxID=332158 RepID=A0ABW3Q0Z4_9BACT|nr:carboxypeptidase-like regulatory domain-containing protein [Larkinella insperata]